MTISDGRYLNSDIPGFLRLSVHPRIFHYHVHPTFFTAGERIFAANPLVYFKKKKESYILFLVHAEFPLVFYVWFFIVLLKTNFFVFEFVQKLEQYTLLVFFFFKSYTINLSYGQGIHSRTRSRHSAREQWKKSY